MHTGEIKDNKLSTFIWLTAMISIGALVILRLYAIFFTVHVVAFDDKGYRRLASNNFESTTVKGAIKDVILPYDGIVYGRVSNYTSWLALGAKFCPSCDRDNVFHLVNFFIFLLQAAMMYVFSFYTSRNHPFSAAFVFLYLSSPISFGMNRFLMPENLVLTAPIVCSFFSFWLAEKKFTSQWSETISAGAIALIIGIFSISRDYAVFSPLLFSFGIILTLLIQKRYTALTSFAIIISLYLIRLSTSLKVIFSSSDKFYCDLYYNPLDKWMIHAILHVAGPAYSILLLFAISYSIYYFLRSSRTWKFYTITNWLKADSVALLLLIQFGLSLLYIAGIFITTTRVARIAVLPLATLGCLTLYLIYEILPLRQILLSKSFKIVSFALIIASWMVLYYQLFIAFDGGKTYAYPAFDMERYNHPLYLRPLNGDDDMHVCGVDSFPPCPPK